MRFVVDAQLPLGLARWRYTDPCGSGAVLRAG